MLDKNRLMEEIKGTIRSKIRVINQQLYRNQDKLVYGARFIEKELDIFLVEKCKFKKTKIDENTVFIKVMENKIMVINPYAVIVFYKNIKETKIVYSIFNSDNSVADICDIYFMAYLEETDRRKANMSEVFGLVSSVYDLRKK